MVVRATCMISMRIRAFCYFFLLAWGPGGFVAGANLPEMSVETLWANHLEAIGGERAARRLTTRKYSGTIDIKSIRKKAKITVVQKAPDKLWRRIEIPGLGIVEEGCDGKQAWSRKPIFGVKKKKGKDLITAMEDARFYRDIERATQFSDWKLLPGKSLEPASPDSFVISRSPSKKYTETLVLNSQTSLIESITKIRKGFLGSQRQTMVVKDYREIDGIVFPFDIAVVEPLSKAYRLVLTNMEHNLQVPDSLFEKPKK